MQPAVWRVVLLVKHPVFRSETSLLLRALREISAGGGCQQQRTEEAPPQREEGFLAREKPSYVDSLRSRFWKRVPSGKTPKEPRRGQAFVIFCVSLGGKHVSILRKSQRVIFALSVFVWLAFCWGSAFPQFSARERTRSVSFQNHIGERITRPNHLLVVPNLGCWKVKHQRPWLHKPDIYMVMYHVATVSCPVHHMNPGPGKTEPLREGVGFPQGSNFWSSKDGSRSVCSWLPFFKKHFWEKLCQTPND